MSIYFEGLFTQYYRIMLLSVSYISYHDTRFSPMQFGNSTVLLSVIGIVVAVEFARSSFTYSC